MALLLWLLLRLLLLLLRLLAQNEYACRTSVQEWQEVGTKVAVLVLCLYADDSLLERQAKKCAEVGRTGT
jgi:hypothetical protein